MIARPGNNPLVPYCSVPEGFYALVTTNGREITVDGTPDGSYVWPAGFLWSSPFTRVSCLITKQTVIFDAPVKGCKTADNVTVQIDVSVAFRIMGDEKRGEDPGLVRIFVHQVTPAGLESQLKDALAEEIRTLARSLKHTEVYACRTGAASAVATASENKDGLNVNDNPVPALIASAPVELDEDAAMAQIGVDVTLAMKKRLNEQFEPQGVQISDVMIQDVVLPEGIVKNMSNKSLVRSKQEYEMMEQSFEMQTIQLSNEAFARKVDHQEQQERSQVVGARDVQAERDRLKEVKAQRYRELQEFEEYTRQEQKKIVAETTELMVGLEFKKKRVLQTLRLEAEDEAKSIRASAQAKVHEVQAKAELDVARENAKATGVMAEAELKADAMLTTQREMELIDKKLDVYNSFVDNDGVVVSGSDEKEVNTLLLSDSVLNDKNQNNSHNSIMAELNVLRLASSAYGLQKGGTYIPGGDANARSVVPGIF